MTDDIFNRITSCNVPDFSIPVIDIENQGIIGKQFYSSDSTKSFKDKLAMYIIDKYRKEGFKIFIPAYKGEKFTLLAEKEESKIILHLVLDSEEERVAWRLSELRGKGYRLQLVRDRDEKELEGIEDVNLADIVLIK